MEPHRVDEKKPRNIAPHDPRTLLMTAERAAQELWESERRFRDMLSNLELVSVMLDREGRITYCNDYLLKATGWQLEEVLGKNWMDLFLPSELIADLKRVHHALVTELPQARHHENEILTRTGERRLFRWNNSLLCSASGEVIGTVSIGEDITESERSKSGLVDSRRFLQSALNALSSHIAILDENGMILAVNAAWTRFAALNQTECKHCGVGDNYLHVCDSAVGNFSAGSTEAANGIRAVIGGEREEFHLEYPCHSPREKRWFIVRVTRFDGEGPARVVVAHENITERKLTENTLARTEALYRQAIAGAGAVPYSLDYKTKSYVFIGNGIEQLIGYAPGEVNGQLWKQIIRESTMTGKTAGLPKAEAIRRVAIGEISSWSCDMRVQTRSGRFCWIADASVQRLNESGQVVGSMGILQDITERKQAEISALAFSRLGDRLSSTTSTQNAYEVIKEVSRELFGWDAFWIQLYDAKTDLIHSEFTVDTVNGKQVVGGRSGPRKPTELYRRILSHGAELIERADHLTPPQVAVPFGNESRLSAVIVLVPIRCHREAVGVLSIQSYTPNAFNEQDLKALQTMADLCGGTFERIWADEARFKSESQFRLVWQASADGMRLADRDGIILMVNSVFCEMVGKSKAELEGQPISIVQQPERAGQIIQKHQAQIDGRLLPSHLEKEITLWDSRKVWFELSNSLLDLPDQPSLMLSIFRDITSRKQAEAELAQTHLELLETSRQAGMAEVATGVLHNVGNVLNSVNVASAYVATSIRKSKSANLSKVVALLREHEADLGAFLTDDDKGRQIPGYLAQLAAHLAEEQTGALTELAGLQKNIEHIKDIVTMQQSFAKVAGATETLAVTDLVEDALKMNSTGLARHDVAVTRNFQVVPLITVEKHKALQILVNLVRNAKQACDEAGPREKRLTLLVTNGNDRVRIAVTDNGIGIPAENLSRIFAHGFTTKKSGHGFGLHSGSLAAREMGGSLSVQSDGLDLGSTFTLELPLTPGTQL